MKKKEIVVSETFLETFGTGTLIGSSLDDEYGLPDELALVFPQTSLRFRETNGGPLMLVVTEYAIQCLVADVLSLRERGVAVTVEERTQDPA